MEKLTQTIVDQFEQLESKLNGSKSLPFHQVRRKALESIQTTGLPGNKHEEYKFTRLTSFLEKNLDLGKVNTPADLTEEQIGSALMAELTSTTLVFVNDVLMQDQSHIHEAHQNIVIERLEDSVLSSTDEIEHYFHEQKSFQNDGYLAWNTAFAENGVHIKVPRNETSNVPIYLCFISDAQHGQVINKPRVLIELGENSEVSFIERFTTVGNHLSFNNAVVDIISGKASRGNYIKIQNDHDQAVLMNTTQLYLPDSSTFSCYTFTFSGKLVRNNLNFVVDGEGSEANMYGLYVTKGNTHVDNHTSVDHRQPNSFSNEHYKGIMDGDSRGVFNGKIFVRQAAQKTNAFQANNNILVSDNATINTKPQLEIWADDVKCSHGCTIGQLDEEQLFYLRSRGIGHDQAVGMLLHAFASDVINRIPVEKVREQLEQQILETLS